MKLQVMKDYPGVPGLFVAGVFSGALSTVSSGLNSLAAVTLRYHTVRMLLVLREIKCSLSKDKIGPYF